MTGDDEVRSGAAARPGGPSHGGPGATGAPGWNALHLFCTVGRETDRAGVEVAVKACEAAGNGVVTASMLGHKSDLGVLALGPSLPALRALQTGLVDAGCTVAYSYVSLTEVSEYAAGVPEKMREARLHPVLPPEAMPAFCFYPMSKRRTGEDNWYRLGYDERLALMHGHGATGRTFHGRVLQLVTGSTGLDDWEWGVTLFSVSLDELKSCVYTMRFDEASARYAEFGPFLVGTVGTLAEVLDTLGVHGTRS
ncbi:MAG: chlorite dismutase family protein [Actinomycetota bacterium]|nr:chlorite dismutase family protein [Actinomycetota bacterium]